MDGLITFKGRVFIIDSSPLVPVVLAAAQTVGHGVQKTLHQLRADFFIPHARRLVQEFLRTCTCQRNKTTHLHPAGLLQPLEVPSKI